MRAPILALLLAAFAPPAPAIAQPPRSELSADSERRWVPFDLTPGNQIRFRMTVNGRTAVAILDTGVSYTVASTAFAAAIGLRPAASGRAEAVGGTVPLGWTAVEQLAIGGLSRSGGRVAVAELHAIATGGADPVDMLVGADLLAGQAIDIDYAARRFRLLPSGRMPFAGASAPLSLARASGVFLSDATIGGRRLRPMIVDTGDGSEITLSREAFEATRLRPERLTSAYAYGLGGAIETDLTVLPAMRVGAMVARDVELRIERGGGFSTLTGTSGRIGSGFLQRYRVLLDPGARRMVLAPVPGAASAVQRSTSGLLIALEGDRLRVLHVMRNSPAAATGWRAGDLVCRVDDQAINKDYLASPGAGWPAGAPGRIVRLTLCGTGATRTLTLARFY